MECFTVNLSSTQETHKRTMPKKKKKKKKKRILFLFMEKGGEKKQGQGSPPRGPPDHSGIHTGVPPRACLITLGRGQTLQLTPLPLWPEKAKSQLFKHRGTGLSLLGAEEVFCFLPVYHMKRWPL